MIRALAVAAALLLPVAAAAAPVYVIAELAPHDREAYVRDYASKVAPVVAAHGGRYLARGGEVDALEGDAPTARVIILEFPSAAAARAFWNSPEYQPLAAARRQLATGRIFMVEGADGKTP